MVAALLPDLSATTTDGNVTVGYRHQEDVNLQRTVRITSTADNITSIATVKINADADSYGIVSWTTQYVRSPSGLAEGGERPEQCLQ